MIDKTYSTLGNALAGLKDGMTVMVGGFGGAGTPFNLVDAARDMGIKDLTVICNSFNNIITLKEWQIKKLICSFPASALRASLSNPFEAAMLAGKIAVELTPQGSMSERIRAGGAGVVAIYVATGVGTKIEQGKEKRVFDGQEYLLERALRADFALIKAYKADIKGNLIYRRSMRNFNPVMAMAADVVVAEVEDIVKPGEIDPEVVVTPGIFIDRIIKLPPQQAYFRARQASRKAAESTKK